MNKKGEFNWGLFGVLLFAFFLIGLSIFAAVSSSNAEMDKFERLCEKKGMEYFDYNQVSFSSDITVICLDNNGEQIEVELK